MHIEINGVRYGYDVIRTLASKCPVSGKITILGDLHEYELYPEQTTKIAEAYAEIISELDDRAEIKGYEVVRSMLVLLY